MSPHEQGDPGLERISAAFARALQSRTAALMPYYTLGFPDRESSLKVVEAIAPFSDLLELGIPFSDPIADGPTIQRSTQRALEQGITSRDCLEMVGELRHRGVQIPILMMGYYNPILAYGEKRFVEDMSYFGIDGLIVPDLPFEESADLDGYLAASGLVLIRFIAPTTNRQRMKKIVNKARGFIYMVSIAGVTGARNELPDALPRVVSEVKTLSNAPVAVGFGISSPEQAAAIGAFADGVIVGSALLNTVDAAAEKVSAAVRFVGDLQKSLLLGGGES